MIVARSEIPRYDIAHDFDVDDVCQERAFCITSVGVRFGVHTLGLPT